MAPNPVRPLVGDPAHGFARGLDERLTPHYELPPASETFGANTDDLYSAYPYGRHVREYTRHELVGLLEFMEFAVAPADRIVESAP